MVKKIAAGGMIAFAVSVAFASPADDCAMTIRWCQNRLIHIQDALTKANEKGDAQKAARLQEELTSMQIECGQRITEACGG